MLRYYMDSQTRDALIAESQRRIAIRAANAVPSDNTGPGTLDAPWTEPACLPARDTDAIDVEANSAFAALVSELWAASSNRPSSRVERDTAS